MQSQPSSMAKEKRPIAIDLFAGAGGLSLGFEQAGFDVAAAVEIDPIHCATHEFNFPQTKVICASVVDVTGESIRAGAGIGEQDIDVVCGGAPCQGFSLIGKRAIDDPRNQLVFHYVRIVRELQPKFFVFENVKGLTQGPHKKFLDELIESLTDAGYKVLKDYKVLNAADYAVPQDRKRLFLLGARADVSLPTYPVPRGATTVRQAICDLPNVDQFPELLTADQVKVQFVTDSPYARSLRGLDDDQKNFGYAREFDASLLTSSWRTEHAKASSKRFAATEYGRIEPISRFRKLHPDGLCNTLRAGTDTARGAFTSARPIHPVFARVITVREAARLHSYPDWFRFHVTKWHGFRQIGNSVPPLLGRAVAQQIVNALGHHATRPETTLKLGDEKLLHLDMSAAASHFSVAQDVIAKRTRKPEVVTTPPKSSVAGRGKRALSNKAEHRTLKAA